MSGNDEPHMAYNTLATFVPGLKTLKTNETQMSTQYEYKRVRTIGRDEQREQREQSVKKF